MKQVTCQFQRIVLSVSAAILVGVCVSGSVVSAQSQLGTGFEESAENLYSNSQDQIFAEMAIQEFHKVNNNIYRGGRPDSAGLNMLVKQGIKTIINLENDAAVVANETAAAAKLGMRTISMPMDWDTRPTDETIDGILAIMGDMKRFPLYVHCKHGQDRTGLVFGLYRVLNDRWKPKDAYQEMLADGFHIKFDKLLQYFKDKTGFSQ